MRAGSYTLQPESTWIKASPKPGDPKETKDLYRLRNFFQNNIKNNFNINIISGSLITIKTTWTTIRTKKKTLNDNSNNKATFWSTRASLALRTNEWVNELNRLSPLVNVLSGMKNNNEYWTTTTTTITTTSYSFNDILTISTTS